ncbi:hypothetical protein L7F22_027678 [Adiantum nelumboides]|nr:hypothetical protein [Adiantum nelumboides]
MERRSSSSSQHGRGVVAVVGVGPGLGFSVARRFAREGYSVVILARTYEKLARLVVQLMALERTAHVSAISIDCSDPQSVHDAFESVRSIGVVEVLVYNVNMHLPYLPPHFLDIRAESFQQSLTLPSLGAFHSVQQVLPGMLQRRKGTILFTGASTSIQGEAGSAESACGKFALRALSQCLSKEFQPQGIHVAHIILDGVVRCNRLESMAGQPFLDPDGVAEVYWQIHMQHPSAWTQELDLKPFLPAR